MPEIVADAPVLACYSLFPRLEIEQSQQLGPDPFGPRARDARAFRTTALIAVFTDPVDSRTGPAMTTLSIGSAALPAARRALARLDRRCAKGRLQPDREIWLVDLLQIQPGAVADTSNGRRAKSREVL
jgi:hypothetical protein